MIPVRPDLSFSKPAIRGFFILNSYLDIVLILISRQGGVLVLYSFKAGYFKHVKAVI